jgi:hypothetical protein
VAQGVGPEFKTPVLQNNNNKTLNFILEANVSPSLSLF